MYYLLVIVILVLLSAVVFQLYFFSNLLNKQSSVNLQNSNTLVWLKSTNSSFIFITASGSASAMPDFATVFVNVQAFGSNPAAATNNMSFALHDLNASVLKYINANLSNIRTTSFNIYNRSNFYNQNTSIKKPYVAQESLSIKVPNIDNISNILGAISGVNGTSVTNVMENLSNAQISSLRANALSAAMQNATSQAAILSQNKTLIIRNITVDYYHFYPFSLPSQAFMTSSDKAAQQTPSFFIGNDTITQSITVTFSFAK